MSVEIEFKLTSIGKTDIANLLAGETLEVKKVYITDAQSGDNESYVSSLSGNIVFQGDVYGEVLYEKDEVLYTKDEWDATMPSGTIPDTGLLHVEFFDDSENYYGGKTIAITYTKELEERILCIATGETASDELVVKHFSPLSLSLDLRFESAENISFENINLSFPPATEGRRGSVKLASSADVMAGTGGGVVTSQNLNTRLGDYVTLETTQTISGTKTFTSIYCNYIGDSLNKVSSVYAEDLKGCIPTNTATGMSASSFPKGSIFLSIIEALDMESNPIDVYSGYYLDLTTQTLFNNRVVNIYEAISCNLGEAEVCNGFKRGRNLTSLRLGFKFLSGLSATDNTAGNTLFLVLVMVY